MPLTTNLHKFPEDIGEGINSHLMMIDASDNNNNIADSIQIFVPGGGQSNFSYQQAHLYSDVKLARIATDAVGVGGGVDVPSYAAQKLLGKTLNPGVDILFQSTTLRTFQFNFILAPKNANESTQMFNIVKALRYHAAPEFALGNLAFNVPSEFQIRFFYIDGNRKMTENTRIPKIAKCVLERIDVDYAGVNGEWSTFADGNPVSCMITTQFKEMEIIDKIRIDQQGY